MSVYSETIDTGLFSIIGKNEISMTHISVVTAFANVVTKFGVQNILSGTSGFSIVGEADNRRDAFAMVRAQNPALLLIEPQIEGGSLELVEEVCQAELSTRVVMFYHQTDQHCKEHILGSGLAGYIPQIYGLNVFKSLVKRIYKQENIFVFLEHERHTNTSNAAIDYSPLSKREWEVASTIISGKTYKEAACILHISYSTVKNHLSNIYEKLQLRSRTELFHWIQSRKVEKSIGI